MLADFNGDGLPDLLYSELTNSGACGAGVRCLDVYLNSGARFEATPMRQPVPDFRGVQRTTTGQDRHTQQDLVDVNGDGLPDWVRVETDQTWRVQLNMGGVLEPLSGTSEPRNWSAGNGLSGPIRQELGDHTHMDMFDYDGDGMLDHVKNELNGQWRIWPSGNATKPLLLTAMQNGLGGTTSLRYGPSTRCGSYVCDHTGGDGKPDLPFVNWVVTGIHESDGLCTPAEGQEFNAGETCLTGGHGRLATFTYTGGRFNAQEREFRGFRTVYRWDADFNLTATTFGQDRPTRGRVLDVSTYLAYFWRVRYEVNEWHTAPAGNHTQIWLHKTGFAQYDGQEGQVFPLARSTENDPPDAYGNITHSFTSGPPSASIASTHGPSMPPRRAAARCSINPGAAIRNVRATASRSPSSGSITTIWPTEA